MCLLFCGKLVLVTCEQSRLPWFAAGGVAHNTAQLLLLVHAFWEDFVVMRAGPAALCMPVLTTREDSCGDADWMLGLAVPSAGHACASLNCPMRPLRVRIDR